jgi:hypothetical protein
VAYGYNADDYISLRDDLEGEWQELYYVLPKFKLNDDDIDTDSDKNFADGLMSIDLEAIGGDITLTAINVKDEGVYDQGSYLTGSGWDVVIEIDGTSHNDKEEYDKGRENYLMNLGLKIYRISDLRVKHDLRNVLQELEVFIIRVYSR